MVMTMARAMCAWDERLAHNSIDSNVEYFLQCVTPAVSLATNPTLPKKSNRGEEGGGNKKRKKKKKKKNRKVEKGYKLKELWKCYEEWSYCGVGVPILFENGVDTVVQYYSPTLSALQIFTTKPLLPPPTPTPTPTPINQPCYIFSTSNKDKATQTLNHHLWTCQTHHNPNYFYYYYYYSFLNWNSSSSSDFNNNHPNKPHQQLPLLSSSSSSSSSSHHNQTVDRFGYLYCQFNETTPPYDRLPLKHKIKELAKQYPGLINLHSSDLSPYSWFAVAWYPIYQIPAVKNEKDLTACFITYHPLSTCGQGDQRVQEIVEVKKGKEILEEKVEKVLVAPFAMANYQIFGRLWKKAETSDEERLEAQQKAAMSWLNHLNFIHNDFNFFMSRKLH